MPTPEEIAAQEAADKADAKSKADQDAADKAVREAENNYNSPVRKTVAEIVAERQAKREEKNKQQKRDDGNEPDNQDDDEFESKINAALEKRLNPILETVGQNLDEAELRDFLSQPGNERFKKYEAKARKDLKAYPTVPVSKIFNALWAEDNSDSDNEGERKPKPRGTSPRVENANSAIPELSKLNMSNIKEFNQKIMGGRRIEMVDKNEE